MSESIRICSSHVGIFDVKSESGKQGVLFDEDERFGPSFIHPRKGDLSIIPERHWFWRFYAPWRQNGRPTSGSPLTAAIGVIHRAEWVPGTKRP